MSIYQVICQIIGFKDIFSNIPLSWIWDKVINRVPSIDNSLHLHDNIYFHERTHFSVNHSRSIQPLQAFPVSTSVAIDTLRWPLLVSHQRYSCQARVTSWWVEHPKSSKAPGESCGTGPLEMKTSKCFERVFGVPPIQCWLLNDTMDMEFSTVAVNDVSPDW